MRNKTRKLLSTLLTLTMLVSLITVVPLTASAAGHDNAIIDISMLEGTDVTVGTYTNWSYNDSTTAITLSGNVEIIGTKTGAINGDPLTIYAGGNQVTWTASYSDDTVTTILIDYYGTSFVMNSGSINYSGGVIAFRGNGTGNGIIINGGSIQSQSAWCAISSRDVKITNGTVSSSGSIYTIYQGLEDSELNISGGTVSATGTGTAINSAGKVTLDGGDVTATSGSAIIANEIEVTGTATVSNDGPAPAIVVWDLWTASAGDLTVNGDVTVSGDDGEIYAGTGTGGEILIYGNVSLDGDDNYLGTANSGYLTIIGDVEFTGTNEKIISADGGGETYITGAITGSPEIWVGGSAFTGSPTSGYTTPIPPYDKYFWDEYTDGTSYVYLASKSKDVIDLDEPWFGDTTNYVDCLPCWEYDNVSNTIKVYDDVTVIGSYTVATEQLNIVIDAGCDVTWTADYSGSLGSGTHDGLIYVTGAGTFVMNDGSIIAENHRALNANTVTINNGTVENHAWNFPTIAANFITITDGIVRNTDGALVIDNNSAATNTINISGGTVSSTATGRSGYAVSSLGNISISGSAKVSSLDSYAIGLITNGAITISGGTVEAAGTVAAIYADGTSSVTVSGGTVEATGTGTAINAANIVTLAGCTVTANTGTAIEAPEIRVTGTATVENSASATDPAIKVGQLYTWNAAGNLTVNGNVVAEGTTQTAISANAASGTQITINGDVTLNGGSSFRGVQASSEGSLTINGNLTFDMSIATFIMIEAGFGGKVYIAGTITGDPDVHVGSKMLTIGTPTSIVTLAYPYNGYYWDEYVDDTVDPMPYVYIRQGLAPIPVISTVTGALANGTVGTAYSVTLAATNTPTSWTVVAPGTLPAGLTISNAGVISGTPTAAGTSNFSITATNGIGDSAPVAYSITISAASPSTPTGGGGGGGAAPTYTVTFVTNGGSAVASGKVAANGKLTKPADPTREGYDFAGWYTNAGLTTPYDFNSSVTEGFTLYAKWTEKGPTPVTPEMPVNPFTDVKGTDWFIDDVIYAYDKGLIDGTSPTTFSPNSNLTYAQAVTLAARMHQLYTKGEITLENGDDPWYQPYVDYAIENGIISGDYDWGAMATRAGYMQIFANALPNDAFAAINSVPDGSIPDVPMDYPGAAAIYKLYRAGILQGNDATHKCSPDNNIRRSEVAAILTRMMNPDARISFSM